MENPVTSGNVEADAQQAVKRAPIDLENIQDDIQDATEHAPCDLENPQENIQQPVEEISTNSGDHLDDVQQAAKETSTETEDTQNGVQLTADETNFSVSPSLISDHDADTKSSTGSVFDHPMPESVIDHEQATSAHGSNRSAANTHISTRSEYAENFIKATHKNFLPVVEHPKPGFRECNWAQFKTRHFDEPLFSIDVLVCQQDLKLQIYEESIRRGRGKLDKLPGTDNMSYEDIARAMMGDGTPPHIERIRIQSGVILGLLNRVSGSSWDITKSLTFMRPFGFLIHHFDAVWQELQKLESVNAQQVYIGVQDQHECHDHDAASRTAQVNTESVLEEIRSFVSFVDNSLMPLYRQFESTINGSQSIAFDELWYLFRPGELIYVPRYAFDEYHKETLRDEKSQMPGEQTIWRVSNVRPNNNGVRDSLLFDELLSINEYVGNHDGNLVVRFYYLDYNGDHIVPVWRTIAIAPFIGRREIRTLAVYPVRFMTDSKATLLEAKDRGRKFISFINTKHMLFTGNDLWHHPDGSVSKTWDGYNTQFGERCDGDDVIVDFKKALMSNRNWCFDHQPSTPYEDDLRTTIGVYRTLVGPSETRPHISAHFELIACRDGIHCFEHAKMLGSDRYIGRTPPTIQEFNELPKNEDDFVLFPCRMYVFNIRLRMFLLVNVLDLSPVVRQPAALDRLQIDDGNRSTIKGVIEAHIRRKSTAKLTSRIDTLNLIPGKGHGSLILLHGAPGIGKTATAEAVAHAYSLPLISIQHIDIESTGERLVRLFQRAEDWDCVLLLDEVDVYLSRRNPHDHDSNIIVSLFLRILETFNGILFLTTNRPGFLDEAVKSRIQLNLHYKPLDLNQTLGIFNLLIEQLETSEKERGTAGGYTPLVVCKSLILKFAQNHYENEANSEGMGRWNGRQIKNAFRIASSLAQYEALNESSDFQIQLRDSHFKDVERLTLDYDHARSSILSFKSDAEDALSRGERNDYPKPPQQRSSSSLATPRRQHDSWGSIPSRNAQGASVSTEKSPAYRYQGDTNTRTDPHLNTPSSFEQTRRSLDFRSQRAEREYD